MSNAACHADNQTQQSNPCNTHRLARSLVASLLIAALLTSASQAQPFPESDHQKAEEARKKADDKATDEAYKNILKHTQDVKKIIDPWGNVRTSPASSGK